MKNKKAEKIHEFVYKKHIEYWKEVDGEPFIADLKAAQSKWMAYRDAELKYELNVSGGSARALWHYEYLTDLTNERTARMKIFFEEDNDETSRKLLDDIHKMAK